MQKADWDEEKGRIDKLSRLREEITEVNAEIEIAKQKSDYVKAGELQYGRLPKL